MFSVMLGLVVCAYLNLNREQCTSVPELKDENMLNKYGSTPFGFGGHNVGQGQGKQTNVVLKYVVYLPPINVLLLEGFSVKLGPGPQVLQPGYDFLCRPARHRFTDQRVMLLHHTTAPVIHQHHHLETHRYSQTRYSEHSCLYHTRMHYIFGCKENIWFIKLLLVRSRGLTGLHGGWNPS